MDGEVRSELGTIGDDILFGPFRLLISARRLERGGNAIPIGSRALDLLVALVERAGEILSKSELIERAWPNLHVDEANLRVHIANLRKFLDDDSDTPRYVANVPSRGYVFVAPVRENAKPIAESSAQPRQVFCLPLTPARIVGREDTIAALIEQLAHARFISLVGPGGLGKTTLALSLAHQLRDAFQDQVAFVDLSVISDPDLATAQVASALGCQAYAEDPRAAVALFVRQRRLLLVLDNCEHVIDAISTLAERLFREAPSLSLLTTSREALRVEGETVHFVEPLAMPSMSEDMTLDQAAQSAAVRLFLDRGLAGGAGAQFTDEDAGPIVEICRRLDGIPLAIELAASRVGSYGVQATARLLNERLELLWRGRRSAPSRHQTLGAMLDWSYHLLSENERSILASLSIFMGPFSLTSAQAVCQDEHSEKEVAEALGGLVDKSLLSVVADGRAPLFRLLDTTRSYARDKLATGARKEAVSRRHAMYVCGVLEGFDTSVAPFANRDILPFLGDVRAALAWVCADFTSFEFGVNLVVGAERFFLRLSLLREARAWCERAMAILPADKRGGAYELEILIGLAISAMFTAGNSDEVLASIHRGLDIAETLGRRRDQLTLLSGLHLFLTRTGKFLETVSVAERFGTIAREAGTLVQQISADFMLGTSRHLVGPQDLAVEHCEAGLKRSGKSLGQDFDQFGFDHRVRALVAYARSLWLAGRPDQAAVACRQVIAEAEQLGQPTNICIAHIYSATVFVWRGDLGRASECVARLVQEATVHHLAPYAAVGRAIQACIAMRMEPSDAALSELHDAIATLQKERHVILVSEFWCLLAETYVREGRGTDAGIAIAAARDARSGLGVSWQDSEAIRIAGEAMIDVDEAEAERLLTEALALARAQRAQSLILRTAISFAKLRKRRSRDCGARDLLSNALSQFSEGFETADLREAIKILAGDGVDPGIVLIDMVPEMTGDQISVTDRPAASRARPSADSAI